ncbi:uncharacterized protein G2W53_030058 [Senna tora]|uniref:Uncharacterized protein n=1 Tax=Senna tora TaxID=362788 RepID=A0A834TF58_9FABA|nr:uncharacterized protein G2W53_030058 [Senna tora]
MTGNLMHQSLSRGSIFKRAEAQSAFQPVARSDIFFFTQAKLSCVYIYIYHTPLALALLDKPKLRLYFAGGVVSESSPDALGSRSSRVSCTFDGVSGCVFSDPIFLGSVMISHGSGVERN